MKERTRKKMLCITGLLTGIGFLVMYAVHREIPFMMDDLWYATMLSDDTPITSLKDIVTSQIWHYYNWGGRSMTHAMLQLTLLMGEQAADICNLIMTVLLSLMICIVARNRNLPAFWAGGAMVLGLNANWKMSMFWQAGAANYLYITVFILTFLWCYLRELPQQPTDTTVPKQLKGIPVWILPLGLVAGWSNENMGPVAWLLSLAVILLAFREKRKVHLWMFLGNISCLLGSVLMIAAPGNFVRSSEIKENQYGLLWRCFLRGYAESTAVFQYLFPTFLVLGFVLIAAKGILKCEIGRKNLLLLCGAFLSVAAMVLSPHYPDRATFGTMVLCICVILSMAGKILEKRRDLGWMLWAAAAFIWARGMYNCGEYLAIIFGWIR